MREGVGGISREANLHDGLSKAGSFALLFIFCWLGYFYILGF